MSIFLINGISANRKRFNYAFFCIKKIMVIYDNPKADDKFVLMNYAEMNSLTKCNNIVQQ
jgi:hypothetical protein